MALTGLQIQKLLPKTNCKECGSNTCLAFAMKLAGKKAEVSECPYISEEAKQILAAQSEPPIRTVSMGEGARAFQAGGETVVYRHEKTFVNQTGIGLGLSDCLEDVEIEQRVSAVTAYSLERVGETLRPNLISVEWQSGSKEKFLGVLEKVSSLWQGPIAARTDNAELLTEVAHRYTGKRILLASATPETITALLPVAKETQSILALGASTLDEIVAMVEKAREADFRDLYINLRADSLCEHFQNNTILRRAALKSGMKSLGYPLLSYVDTGDPMDNAVEAGIEIAKYGGMAVLPEFDPAVFVGLLALRQNLFTDPQKPIQVEPKIYSIGEPTDQSPVFVTTNFSLTYFIVSGEIENSGLSAWLVIPECEGMSVLTAWAAGKFGGAKVAAFMKEVGIEEKTRNRTVVIPGYVSQISGELEESLPGWKVLVGPQEAGDIEPFVKNVLQAA
jgi:acetyl-CoA decarbonylase/synthase, CODH/ACS complex subunit gamma